MTAYLRQNAIAIVAMAIVATLAASQIGALSKYLDQRHLRSLPTNEFVDYEYVEYVDIDPNGRNGTGAIRMRSRSAFPHGGDIAWNDVLYCDDPETGAQQLVSSQSTARTGTEPRPEPQTSPPWHYAGSYPLESTCRMVSTITVTVNEVAKSQTVHTDDFAT